MNGRTFTATFFICLLFGSQIANISAERNIFVVSTRAARLEQLLGEDFVALQYDMIQLSEELNAFDSDHDFKNVGRATGVVRKDCKTIRKEFEKADSELVEFAESLSPGSRGGVRTTVRLSRRFLVVSKALEDAKKIDSSNFCGLNVTKHIKELRRVLESHESQKCKKASDSVRLEGQTSQQFNEFFVKKLDAITECKEPSTAQVRAEVKTRNEHLLREAEEERIAEAYQSQAEALGGQAKAALETKPQAMLQNGSAERVAMAVGTRSSPHQIWPHMHLADQGTSGTEAALSEIMEKIDTKIDRSAAKLDRLLDSGTDEEVARYARTLLFGETEDEGDIFMVVLGCVIFCLMLIGCGGATLIWMLLGVVVCIVYAIIKACMSFFGGKSKSILEDSSSEFSNRSSSGSSSFKSFNSSFLEVSSSSDSSGFGKCYMKGFNYLPSGDVIDCMRW